MAAIRRRFDAIGGNWHDRQRRKTLRGIRESLAWFGCPVDNLSDEDIERGCVNIGNAVATFGITAREAAARFEEITRITHSVSNTSISGNGTPSD